MNNRTPYEVIMPEGASTFYGEIGDNGFWLHNGDELTLTNKEASEVEQHLKAQFPQWGEQAELRRR